MAITSDRQLITEDEVLFNGPEDLDFWRSVLDSFINKRTGDGICGCMFAVSFKRGEMDHWQRRFKQLLTHYPGNKMRPLVGHRWWPINDHQSRINVLNLLKDGKLGLQR